ncbi:hypothetical protein TNCV_266951 [Trichonephila clavipes]|nr:hypothetical protein TNCV_266951 [Trichonephila clavipes]
MQPKRLSKHGLLCCLTDDLQWRVIQGTSGGNNALDTIKTLKDTVIDVFHGGTVTGLRYRDELIHNWSKKNRAKTIFGTNGIVLIR